MYFYRCTEQQLGEALERIDEAGDTLLHVAFKGGRDYVLICRKAGTGSEATALATAINRAAAEGAQR